jgi:DNA-directed RNA polymerase specialized sigma subunit
MAINRPKIPKSLEDKPRSYWENIINEYIKVEDDRNIATLYYLDGYPQIDIAEMIGCSRSKIKSRLPKLINIIEKNSK